MCTQLLHGSTPFCAQGMYYHESWLIVTVHLSGTQYSWHTCAHNYCMVPPLYVLEECDDCCLAHYCLLEISVVTICGGRV